MLAKQLYTGARKEQQIIIEFVEYTVTFFSEHTGVLYAQTSIGPVRIAEFKRVGDHWTFRTLGVRMFYTIGYDIYEACTSYLQFIGESKASVRYPLKPAA